MLDFDLELASKGEPVVTRRGVPVVIVKTDVNHPDYPVLALLCYAGCQYPYAFTSEGRCYTNRESEKDLFMKG